jgi:hypothetical protein
MPDEEHPEDGVDEVPDNVLYELYEQYIGEPEEDTDVYLGFGLFFSGVGMGILSLLLFGVSFGVLEYGSNPYWLWSEVAYAVGLLALPATITGIVVLLPVEERAVYAAGAGAVVNVVAVLWFVTAYPNNWNNFGVGTTLGVVSLYAVGLLLVVGSTGAALIADQLQRYQTPGPADIEPVEEDEDESESISDEQIEADIEDAMSGVELSWGGVERSENRNLQFSEDADMSGAQLSGGMAKTTRSSGVDSQIDSLKAMKGGEKKTARSESTVDDQTKKLKELRERRQREQAQKDAAAGGAGVGSSGRGSGGIIGRVKGLLGWS